MNFVTAFAPLNPVPVFKRVKVLLLGAILSPASRTVRERFAGHGIFSGEKFSAISSGFESRYLEPAGRLTNPAQSLN